MPSGTNGVKAKWQGLAQQGLPGEDAILQRNSAITKRYAEWYSQPPHLFKWAGAAAFSSHRVGLLLAAYDLTVHSGAITAAAQVVGGLGQVMHGHSDPATLLADLELIRSTNNLVFNDIGWAHLAYADAHGGIAAVEAGLAGDADSALMLAGFREIEKGRAVLAADPAQAHALFWSGNRLLLQHEQTVVVQQQFDKMTPGMRLFLSLMTWMDFDLEGFRFLSWADLASDGKNLWWLALQALGHHPTFTSFFVFMQTPPANALLAASPGAPDITRIEQRWSWADTDVLGIWRYVEGHDPALMQKMQAIMQGPLIG
jgi:hypothetical protein